LKEIATAGCAGLAMTGGILVGQMGIYTIAVIVPKNPVILSEAKDLSGLARSF
jgi:hypothetical protein